MKKFSTVKSSVVHGLRGFAPHGDNLEFMMRCFVERLLKDDIDQTKIFNVLRIDYPSAKLGFKRSDQPIYIEPIPKRYRASEKFYYRFENVIFALLCILFKGYDVNISLTQSLGGDGGFDIAITDKDTDAVHLVIDVKSGKNSSNNHVEWHSIGENGTFWLLRVVKDAPDGLGSLSNERGEKIHVLDMNLDAFISNLVDVYLDDVDYLNDVRACERRLAERLRDFGERVKR